MVEFILVISDPETRKAVQRKLSDPKTTSLMGKKIGDRVEGKDLGFPDSLLMITGGTDKDGFPMRWDVHGPVKKRILISNGPGFRPREKGERRRKTVRGSVINEDTRQINLKIIEKRDRKGIEALFMKFSQEKKGKSG